MMSDLSGPVFDGKQSIYVWFKNTWRCCCCVWQWQEMSVLPSAGTELDDPYRTETDSDYYSPGNLPSPMLTLEHRHVFPVMASPHRVKLEGGEEEGPVLAARSVQPPARSVDYLQEVESKVYSHVPVALQKRLPSYVVPVGQLQHDVWAMRLGALCQKFMAFQKNKPQQRLRRSADEEWRIQQNVALIDNFALKTMAWDVPKLYASSHALSQVPFRGNPYHQPGAVPDTWVVNLRLMAQVFWSAMRAHYESFEFDPLDPVENDLNQEAMLLNEQLQGMGSWQNQA
jgi:hypothetical protein